MTADSSQGAADGQPGDSPPSAKEVKRRMKAILRRFPDRFSADQEDEIRRRVARSITLGEKLGAIDLPNGTGPNFDPRAMTNV